MAVGTAALKPGFDLIVSDGRRYYVYLPSLLCDGDLDFSNQIREHWGPDFSPTLLTHHTERGLIPDKYPIGVALSLLPTFLVARLFGGDGYGLHYQLLILAQIIAMGLAIMMLSDRMSTRVFGFIIIFASRSWPM
jgi:hypothetical protein